MISTVFVDRSRLAIVISVLITLAGLIAIRALPVAQFANVVPPRWTSPPSTPAPIRRWSRGTA
jgi:multidrug efflux pump subunit AcrB